MSKYLPAVLERLDKVLDRGDELRARLSRDPPLTPDEVHDAGWELELVATRLLLLIRRLSP